MTTTQATGVALYERFLGAFNSADIDAVANLVDPAFVDHHPGFEDALIENREAYLAALRGAHESLRLRGRLEEAFEVGDRVITRCQLTGTHSGEAMGFAPTGRPLSWTTTEIWRIADSRFVERWAQDDLLGLRNQLSPDAANVALIRRLNDVVNDRRYDDMDELFSVSFVDNNPAWSVKSLDELKDIIRSVKAVLDFTSNQDMVYAADDGKVVIHLTFTGRHIGEIFGRAPTGNEVSWTSIEVYRIEGGRIAERWVQADTTGLMKQLGVPLP